MSGSGERRARVFADRVEAGQLLADRIAPMVQGEPCVVLGLPRGGVPVAEVIARRIGAPLDVLIVRKLGVPWQPELAFGAVSSGDVVVTNADVVRAAGLEPSDMEAVIERERAELQRRELLFHGARAPLPVEERTVVLVDDGIATGATVRAALDALAARGAGRTILACPVAPPEVIDALSERADDVVCLSTPYGFQAVGMWYRDFTPVSDDEVEEMLARSDGRRGPGH
jgi:predicted phosphoribosyltransferase